MAQLNDLLVMGQSTLLGPTTIQNTLSVSGQTTLAGVLKLANSTWNYAGDDAYFGDNDTAGSFAIKGINGTTNLKMVQYGGTNYGTLSWDGSKFIFSHPVQGNISSSTIADQVRGAYTANGGQQNPNYFGVNKVGFLMMNTPVNNNSQYKDWIIMDCYSGNDVGGGVALGVNRQALGAYIMRSEAGRTAWAESAELLHTSNYTNYTVTKTGSGARGTWSISVTGSAGSATTATKLGTSTLGSTTQPIYLSSGTATTCSTYAGGTKVTLNGTDKGASTASFYAPTAVGTKGQVLKSNGSGAPVWSTADNVSFTPTLTSGTEIGKITINGKATSLYYQTSASAITYVSFNSSTKTLTITKG